MNAMIEQKINNRINSLRSFLNVQKTKYEKFSKIENSLNALEKRLDNILAYMKSVNVDIDHNESLMDFLFDVCRPKLWDEPDNKKILLFTWALSYCRQNELLDTAWELFTLSDPKTQASIVIHLPEHLRSAAAILQ